MKGGLGWIRGLRGQEQDMSSLALFIPLRGVDQVHTASMVKGSQVKYWLRSEYIMLTYLPVMYSMLVFFSFFPLPFFCFAFPLFS